MNCPKCGFMNSSNSNFCINCGSSIDNIPNTEQVNQSNDSNNLNNLSKVNIFNSGIVNDFTNQQQVNTEKIVNQNNISISIVEYFTLILAFILKPVTIFKDKMNKFTDIKNSLILSLIVSGSATILNLFSTMFNAVVNKDYNLFTGKYTTTIEWANLKDINYIEVIGKNILVYLAIIFGVSAIYYIATLIIKKQTNYSKLATIVGLAIVPMIIATMLLSPILGMIHSTFGLIIGLVGIIYSMILLYEGINHEVKLENDIKLYFNLACSSSIVVIAYFILSKYIISSIF